MEVQVLYFIEYELPLSVTYESVKNYCNDWNIIMEKTGAKRICKFYCSNEHNLWMLQYHNNLISIKENEHV